ncbi:aminoglycoside phosphotransferase family protein [Paenibacillus dokdonensis]|uniref:Aminoglycoside phosphotransferase family protein n=1 Tax=Paenibacillus dokdonensis TaxID=2567944 RepID=A0ABU6GMK8_9BACL|nr:aminoglycoside phosphotransferase family protein [Paenibacillus dokdonensis]MEC0240327.1 aminoglycoside phosphotransferase family protein [Paenibacillus dokdonensis]
MAKMTEIQARMEQIPLLAGSDSMIHIDKGFSGDQKFMVTKESRKYLLRVFDIKLYPQKGMEYEALIRMQHYQVQCSRPLELGRWDDIELGYMILTFIEGEEAAVGISDYSPETQYAIGLEAGAELLKIHQYNAPEFIQSWYERQLKKYHRNRDQYRSCGVQIKDDTKLFAFIDEHLHWMLHRPNRFQHDDFHLANLVVKDGHLSGVIDFNRCDWGDPIHDFLKISFFSSDLSVSFAIGQIHGYHGQQEPDKTFWQMYSLYLAMNLVGSVAWTLRVYPEGISDMMNRIDRVLEDHQYFENMVPVWYNNHNMRQEV